MNLVTGVLVCFIVASVPVCVFGLMLISGERRERKRMTGLCQSGVEVQAKLVSLVPFGNRGYASVTYEFQTPTGTVRHNKGASQGPAHVIGHEYPMVYDPQNTKSVHLGDMAAAHKERRNREGYVRGAQRLTLLSLAAGVLATVGLIVSPS
ncbi:hypothetical protein KV205_04325 [Streptomyces sp. SKN60]|uniref:DUF3592 domain-containing protein n=1 Tax=Streptomyces sp. SKN60 TaxID=2855506 RepID=UPI0022450A53|nr:DUF3592 domain-containing protein [Streptomyces sp. SKN60]MCX2179760.1 hypothetical protein [Streptomyces sp. SKN60]